MATRIVTSKDIFNALCNASCGMSKNNTIGSIGILLSYAGVHDIMVV